MKKIIASFLLCISFISCGNSQEVKSITTAELKFILSKEKIQLLDVRTAGEVKIGSINTAIYADFYDDDFYNKAINQLDKKEEVYLYCRSGGRSMKASKILKEKGYKVINVLGGYNQWKQEN